MTISKNIIKNNVHGLVSIAVLAGMQMIFLAGWYFTMTAPVQNPSHDLFFMPYKATLSYERELEVFIISVNFAILIFMVLMYWFRMRIQDEVFKDIFKPWVLMNTILIFIQAMVSAWAWQTQIRTPAMNISVFIAVGLLILLQLRWKFIRRPFSQLTLKLSAAVKKLQLGKKINWSLDKTGSFSLGANKIFARTLDVFIILAIPLILFVKNIEGLAAKILLGDQGRHLEPVITAPVYAAMSGATVNVDIISQYGIGYAILIGELTKIIGGGFSYEHVLQVLIILGIFYYIFLYILLRLFFSSQLAAIAAIIIIIHAQFFGPMAYPYIHMNPNSGPIRFLFDGVFFLLIWLHIKRAHPTLLYLLALMSGVSLFYLTSLGLALSCVFIIYIFMIFIKSMKISDKGKWKFAGFQFMKFTVILLAIFFILMFFYTKEKIFSQELWFAMCYQAQLIKTGIGNSSIISGISVNPVQFILAIVLPIFYLFIFLRGLAFWWYGINTIELTLSTLLAVYGLSNYQHFVLVSYPAVIYRILWPFFVIIFLGIDSFLRNKASSFARQFIWIILIVVFLMNLWTDSKFSAYPNYICQLQNPYLAMTATHGRPFLNSLAVGYPDHFKLPVNSLGERDEFLKTEKDFSSDQDLVRFYKEQFDFSKDAELIHSLTLPHAPVAIISNFDVAFLAQADRKPFFKIFPLFWSRPIGLRTFPEEFFFTVKNFKMLLSQLQNDQPEYVFIQKIFLAHEIPTSYLYQYEGTVRLIMEILKEYTPYKEGKYLMALKRKDFDE